MHISLSCTFRPFSPLFGSRLLFFFCAIFASFEIEWDHFLGKVCVLVVCSAGQHPSPKLIRIMQTNLWKIRRKKSAFISCCCWVFGLDKNSNVSSHFSSEWECVLIALDVNFKYASGPVSVCWHTEIPAIVTRWPSECVRMDVNLIFYGYSRHIWILQSNGKMVAPNEIWNENATTIPSCWVATIKGKSSCGLELFLPHFQSRRLQRSSRAANVEIEIFCTKCKKPICLLQKTSL